MSFLDLSGKVINQANKIRRELINYHKDALTFKWTSKYPKEKKTNLPLRNNSPIKLTKKNILSDKKINPKFLKKNHLPINFKKSNI